MRRSVYIMTIGSAVLAILSFVLYRTQDIDAALTFSIIFGTIAYHFIMRLAVGALFDTFMKNRADLTKKRYLCRPWEKALYERLQVKQWKKRLPSFKPEYFDRRLHSWEEIAQAMCQAESVHEVIALLSFVPVFFSIWFGELPVFLITSFAAALADLAFAVVQRYNRARIIKLIGSKDLCKSESPALQ